MVHKPGYDFHDDNVAVGSGLHDQGSHDCRADHRVGQALLGQYLPDALARGLRSDFAPQVIAERVSEACPPHPR